MTAHRTVNEQSAMQQLVAAGVDGILTNYPATLQAVIDGKGDGKAQ